MTADPEDTALRDRHRTVALERGEQPTASDINDARALIHQLDIHLDEICALYDIPRWQTGVQWGELDETEREAYHELEG